MEVQDIDSMNALVPLGRCLKMLRYVEVFVDVFKKMNDSNVMLRFFFKFYKVHAESLTFC